MFFLLYRRPLILLNGCKAKIPGDGEKNYIDLGSVRYKQHIVSFWSRNTDRKGEATEISFSVNCKNGTGAVRDIIMYSSNETVLRSYSYKEGKLLWGKIESHSFMNSFKKLLCKD
jgi:hypothetical protein